MSQGEKRGDGNALKSALGRSKEGLASSRSLKLIIAREQIGREIKKKKKEGGGKERDSMVVGLLEKKRSHQPVMKRARLEGK